MGRQTRPRCTACFVVFLMTGLGITLTGQTGSPSLPPVPRDLVEVLPPDQWATLTILNRGIVTFRARVLTNPPAQRAEAAREVIERLVSDNITGPATTRMANQVLFISVGGRDVTNLVAGDVNDLAGETLAGAGTVAAGRLSLALEEASEAKRPWQIARSLVRSLFACAVFALVLGFGRRVQQRSVMAISLTASSRLNKTTAGSWWSQHDNALLRLVRFMVTLVSLAFVILFSYMWATFVLRQFPYTRPWGESLRQYLLNALGSLALGVAGAIPGLLIVLLVVAVTRAFIRMTNAFFENVERGAIQTGWSSAETAGASKRLVSAAVWILALIVAYPYVPGSGTKAFESVGVFVGVLISLGSSGFVNQLISGLTLTYARALHVGDVIRTGEMEGVVVRTGTVSIQLRNIQNELITIPNTMVMSQNTINFSRLAPEGAVSIMTDVTIGYGTPWRQVEALLLLAASRTHGVRQDPAPKVIQVALLDFYVRYRLLGVADGSRARALDALLANIQDAFNEHGVQILSPNFEAQPDQPAVVPRDQWYAAPAVAPNTRTAADAHHRLS